MMDSPMRKRLVDARRLRGIKVGLEGGLDAVARRSTLPRLGRLEEAEREERAMLSDTEEAALTLLMTSWRGGLERGRDYRHTFSAFPADGAVPGGGVTERQQPSLHPLHIHPSNTVLTPSPLERVQAHFGLQVARHPGGGVNGGGGGGANGAGGMQMQGGQVLRSTRWYLQQRMLVN